MSDGPFISETQIDHGEVAAISLFKKIPIFLFIIGTCDALATGSTLFFNHIPANTLSVHRKPPQGLTLARQALFPLEALYVLARSFWFLT
jgi:hypothetical protein